MELNLTSEIFVCNEWTIRFYPLFNKQFLELTREVENLLDKVPRDKYLVHPKVKMLKALLEAIKNKIPSDPFASHFVLQKPLEKYSRLKKMGLNERYRLFFKVYKEQKIIIILWLGYPRKDGDKNDCYTVFKKMVSNGVFAGSIEELIAQCDN